MSLCGAWPRWSEGGWIYSQAAETLLENTEPAAKEAELYPELATGLGSKELPISAKTS